MVGEAAGLFFESGGARESHEMSLLRKFSVFPVYPFCLCDCHPGGRQ